MGRRVIHVQHSRPIERDAEVFSVSCDIHLVLSTVSIPRLEIIRRSSDEAEQYVRGEAQRLMQEMEEVGCDCDKDEYVAWNGVITP